ncbi:MAG TPA: hypothetical protein VGX68_15205 [Thermoanaerobaculia bacterium]|nr:hypothetical protein [Thermoanaerobaculia bacterium]
MKRMCVFSLAVAFLFALPAFARIETVQSGIDVWSTAADGRTFIDFAKRPIPKGFFCPKSQAFTGKVVLRGRPLASGNPGELGGADTIIQRLDDAAFDKDGVAVTRIQMRALQLESVAPLKTVCGDFNARVVTDGVQPVTKMRIIRSRDNGGHFIAPLRVKFRMTFTPASGISAQRLQLTQTFRLLPAPNATWGETRTKRPVTRPAALIVDTDGDQVPDLALPKTNGNFLPGLTPERARLMNANVRRFGKATESCPTTIDYGDGYGVMDCHPIGTVDPSCHPETEGSSHCSQECPPCAVEAVE